MHALKNLKVLESEEKGKCRCKEAMNAANFIYNTSFSIMYSNYVPIKIYLDKIEHG